jgi:large subunit ribosomal protein L18
MAYLKKQKNNKVNSRLRRHARIRTHLSGTSEIPRLAIFKSNRALYAQIIDDTKGVTLASANSLSKKGTMMEKAEYVGETVAKAAQTKKISKVVFDRGGFLYTGQVAMLADAARKAGLKF